MKKTITITIPAQTFEVEIDIGGVNPPTDPPVDPPTPPVSSDFGVGANTFPWVPLSKFSDIGMKHVRLYCPWHWIGTAKGLFIEPMGQAWTNECPGIDTYLSRAKGLGIDTILCLNQTPEWLRPTGNGTGGNDFPPIPEGRDRLKPESYKEYADFLFQIAARYGRKIHPESVLKVDQTPQYPNQPLNQKKSGLDLLNIIECGNEVDHWFSGFDNPKYMQPEEHAAMLSLCYDSIKQADPTMKVAMAGITDLNLWYLKRMNDWFVKNRPDKKFAADFINLHHYSNLGNRPGTDKPIWVNSGACMPSEDKAFPQIVEIVQWAKSLGKECIVTEFGADTKAPSMMHINGSRYGVSDEQAQSTLILKTLDAYEAAGVIAAYIFTAIDENAGADGGQFETSGIMTSKADGMRPKAAYNDLKTLLKR